MSEASTASAHAAARLSRAAPLSPARLRAILVATAVVAAASGYGLTLSADGVQAASEAGIELTRLLRLMTLLKCALGAGALALVWLRFRWPIAPRLAFGYVAGGTVMAAGPGVMWNMAHIGLGALLLHGGLGAMFVLAWCDGGTSWRLAR